MTATDVDNEQLNEVAELLRCLVSIELWKGGVAQAEIGRRLGISAGTVNKYVKGVQRRTPDEARE